MKVAFEIDRKEPEHKKKKLLENLVKSLGSKISIDAEEIEIEKQHEGKVVDILIKSGMKFKKIA